MTNTAKQITSYLEQLRFKTQHIYTVLCQSLEILFIYLYLVRKMVNPYRNMYFWKYFFFKRQKNFFSILPSLKVNISDDKLYYLTQP